MPTVEMMKRVLERHLRVMGGLEGSVAMFAWEGRQKTNERRI
jgi:hypothetical protein